MHTAKGTKIDPKIQNEIGLVVNYMFRSLTDFAKKRVEDGIKLSAFEATQVFFESFVSMSTIFCAKNNIPLEILQEAIGLVYPYSVKNDLINKQKTNNFS